MSYSENLEKVIPLIKSVVHQMDEAARRSLLLEEPQVVGVESMTGTAVTVRILAKAAAERQYGVSREIRERVKAALDEAGVGSPPLAPLRPPAPQGADLRLPRGHPAAGLAPSFERLPG